jgi:DNA-binding XRE family transcriptional regulator
MGKFGQRNLRAAKLTLVKVRQIRELYAEGQYTQGELGKHFGVSAIQIGRIVRGESWNHSDPAAISKAEIEASQERMRHLVNFAPQEVGSPLDRLAGEIAAKKEELQTSDRLLGELTDVPISDAVKAKMKEFTDD